MQRRGETGERDERERERIKSREHAACTVRE